ncbi:MAG: hypothetical protein NTY09_00800 [bacterium]|nr:hypothetical protein [bacterium]
MGLTLAVVPSECDPGTGLFAIDFTLTHPLGGHPEFSVFDVKGIVMAPGSLAIGIMTFSDVDETQLENADGFAQWWNPTEFTANNVFGYMPVFTNTTADNLTATINPYKRFADSIGPIDNLSTLYTTPLNDDLGRGVFRDGSANTRRYMLRFPMDPTPVIVFGFAIDGCWDLPVPNPPTYVPDDFPIAANQPEAYYISMTPIINTLYYDNSAGVGGGVLQMQLDIYDWQGQNAGTIAPQVYAAVVYSPVIYTMSPGTTLVSDGATSARYVTNLITDTNVTHSGDTILAARVGSEGGPNYDQGGLGPAPAIMVSAWQELVLDIPDPQCAGDANNDFGEAADIGLDEGIEGQICLPDDYRDYYSFTIPAVFAAEGSIDFYCDAEPTTIGIYKSNEELIYEESVSGSMASITMDEVTLYPGDYYIRIYTSNAIQVAPYYLDMNITLADHTPSPVDITPDELYCDPYRSFIHDNNLIMIGYSGLWIYDITNTSDPDLVYHDPDNFFGEYEYRWPYIYFAEYVSSPDLYDVSLIDLSTITSPVIHHSVITVGDDIKDFVMNSEYLFIMYEVSDERTLGIYDWPTSPSAPAEIFTTSVLSMDGFYAGLALVNPETASPRLVAWSVGSVELWDVSDPSGGISYLDGSAAADNIADICTSSSYIYVINQGVSTGSFTAYSAVGDMLTLGGSEPISQHPTSICISGDYAYVGGSDNLDVVDISVSTTPNLENSIPVYPYISSVNIEGNLLSLIPTFNGFELYSMSYPQLPNLLYRSPVIDNPKEIEVMSDNYALIADDDYNIYHTLKTVDISNPAATHTVDEFQAGSSIMSLEYYDGTAYAGVGWDIVILDCTDPLNLSPINTIDLGDNIFYFGLYRDTLYAGTGASNLAVFDVTDPSAPVYETSKAVDGNALSFAFNGDYMYIPTSNNVVEIFSVSNAWNPTSLGTFTPGTDPSWVMTQDDYLYVTGENLFEIYDISTPATPLYQGSILGGSYDSFEHTSIDNLYAYIGGAHLSNCTPTICTLWPPSNPSIAYTFDPWDYDTPYDIEVADDILYIASGEGLRIFDLY